MKHIRAFNDFLDDVVNLNQSRLDRLNGHVDAVETFLRKNLDSFIKIEPQGSYATKTIIKPVNDNQEYDADIQIFVEYQEDKEPKDYIEELYDLFSEDGTYEDKVSRSSRCVTLNYARDFHLDCVPCIPKPDGTESICNRKTNQFETTDGTGYRDWFVEKNSITNGYLRKTTKLLKYLRDHKRTFTAKSILLTTLIGSQVGEQEDAVNFRDVPGSLQIITNRINEFLQQNPMMPSICNPALEEEDFNRHWDQDKYDNFRDKFSSYNDRINKAIEEKVHNKSIDKWRDIFGDDFGEYKDDTKSAAVVIGKPRPPYSR